MNLKVKMGLLIAPIVIIVIEKAFFSINVSGAILLTIEIFLLIFLSNKSVINPIYEQYNKLFEISPDAIIVHKEGKIISLNPSAVNLLGMTNSQDNRGKKLMDFVHPNYQKVIKKRIEKVAQEGKVEQLKEYKIINCNGIVKDVEESSFLLSCQDKAVVLSIVHDITERKRNEVAIINHMAYYDTLTGLPNRMFFNERLAKLVDYARRNKEKLAVMFIDLYGFKNINDTLGYHIGDRLIKIVAQRLKDIVCKRDMVARMGGDEFSVLMYGLLGKEDAEIIAKKIIDKFQQPFMVNRRELYVTPSIGISMYPSDGDNIETLVENADLAMYQANNLGINNYCFYDISMKKDVSNRLKRINDLRHAIDGKEFIIYYQPQVNISTGKIIGMEALIRWHHPRLGMISPSDFIPVAEETGLIVPIGEWILRTACSQNKAWQDAGLPLLRVAVNLSPRQFQKENLVDTVARILEETQLEPRYLELEVTESIAIFDIEYVNNILNRLKKLGVRISLDDFGTGYSSLRYFKEFNIDTIKIDRSFTQNLIVDPKNKVIASAIITMAHNLNLTVVAEGIENTEQLNFLKEQMCDDFQGYIFSRPLPVEEIEEIYFNTLNKKQSLQNMTIA